MKKIRQNKKYMETNESEKYNGPKSLGYNKISSKRQLYSNTGIPQETRTFSNKQLILTPKGTRERKKNNLIEGRKQLKLEWK